MRLSRASCEEALEACFSIDPCFACLFQFRPAGQGTWRSFASDRIFRSVRFPGNVLILGTRAQLLFYGLGGGAKIVV